MILIHYSDVLRAAAANVGGRGALLAGPRWRPELDAVAGPAWFSGPPEAEAPSRVSRLQPLATAGVRPLDLVVLEQPLNALALADTLNALRGFADAETVFLLPGAAPTDRAMTGEHDMHPFWAGQVWLAAERLRPAGARFLALTLQLPPAGVLVARDFAALDGAALQAAARRAEATRPDTASFRAGRSITPARVALQALGWRAPDPPAPELPPGRTAVILDETAPDIVRSELLEAETAWDRPPPAFVLDLSGDGLDTRVLQERLRWRQGAQVDHFANVHLIGRDALLSAGETSGARRFYGRYSRPPAVLGGLVTASGLDDPVDASTLMARSGERSFHYPDAILDGSVRLERPVFFATPEEPLNWGLWLLQNVPAAQAFADLRSDYPEFFCHLGQPWQRPFLTALGVPDEALRHHDLSRVHVAPRLATLRPTSRAMHLSERDRAAFDAFGDRCTAVSDGPSFERVYVTRKGLDYHRVLLNEAELADALEARGFKVVSPQTLSLQEQVRLFRRARYVVGLGGAGLFNAVWCRPGTRLVTVESGMTWVDSHCNIFASRGLDYGVILGRQDPDDPTLHHARWTLDVAAAVAAIGAFAP